MLPTRLRPRLAAVGESTSSVAHYDTSRIDPVVLGALASACRECAVTDFRHRGRSGTVTERRVEPHHLVAHGGHWYLIAHDTGRDDWRTFRVDRLADPRPTHRRFTPRELPAPDPAAFLTRHFASGTYVHTVRLTLGIPAEELHWRMYGPIPGRVVPREDHSCEVRISADSLDLVCQYTAAVVSLGVPFALEGPDEAVERLRAVGAGLSRQGAEPTTAVRERNGGAH